VTGLVMQAAKGRLYGGNLVSVSRIGGQCRAVWNLFLAESAARYKAEQKFVFYAEMSARLPKLLKEDPRLAGLPHRAAQMTVQKLDQALRDCFKAKGNARRGFPKFKRWSDRNDAFSFVGREVRVEPGRIRLPKIGWLRVRGLVLPDGADLKQVAVTQEPNGWHVSIQFEAAPKSYPEPTKPVVGIDGGLLHLLTLSDGHRVDHPRIGKKAQKRIRRLNRERDRRRKGSVNRRRTVDRLARAHRRVADARRDHMHKRTRELVDTYVGFAVEDLSLRGMMRTRLAGSLADAGLGEALRTLRYKAEWAGREWRVHARFRRSTGVCPETGLIGPKLTLSERSWVCDCCGIRHDRDVAAARVILAGATAGQPAAVGQALPEPAGAIQRERSSAVRGGVRAAARASHGGPLPNVAKVASCD
jgi:putative transposase